VRDEVEQKWPTLSSTAERVGSPTLNEELLAHGTSISSVQAKTLLQTLPANPTANPADPTTPATDVLPPFNVEALKISAPLAAKHFIAAYLRDIIFTGTSTYVYQAGCWFPRSRNYLDGVIAETLSNVTCDGNVTTKTLRDLTHAVKAIYTRQYERHVFRAKSHLILFKNGVYDVKNYELLPFNRKHYFTTPSSIVFDHNADCPTWRNFLTQTLNDDDQLISLLQEFMGYALIPSNAHQKALLLMGASRAGKGLIIKILQAMVGLDACRSIRPEEFASEARFCFSGMRYHKLMVLEEINTLGGRGTVHFRQRLTDITGGGHISFEEKYQSVASSAPFLGKIVMTSNSMPTVYDASSAYTNRLIVIPFKKSFAGKEDIYLLDKLKRELPGIINWALDGLQRLELLGFTESETSEAIKDVLRDESNYIGAFCKAHIEPTTDVEEMVSVHEVKEAVLQFLTDDQDYTRPTAEKLIDRRTFVRDVCTCLDATKKQLRKSSGERVRVIFGFKLKGEE
jgi:P4 family phage/plasmid primase-like protien